MEIIFGRLYKCLAKEKNPSTENLLSSPLAKLWKVHVKTIQNYNIKISVIAGEIIDAQK